jgi:hypothetical protein
MKNEDATPAPKKTTPAPAAPQLQPGDEVKHASGEVFTVRAILPEGVALEGVANLVPRESVRPV